MTEEDIKEGLSNSYVKIIANRHGYILDKPEKDLGVDYYLDYTIKRRLPNGSYRVTPAGDKLDLQLKSTTIKSVETKNGHIVYDLEATTYNDLVYRKINGLNPLVLILFILPAHKSQWVNVLKTRISLSRDAYWYYPPDTANEEVFNKRTKRIFIPLKNKLDSHFFKHQIKQWKDRWRSTSYHT